MSHAPTRNPKLAASLALALFASAALAYIISGHASGAGNNDTALRAVFDQERFHLEAIIRFSAQWPFLDFSDYESATTPGYHVALAAILARFDPGRDALRIVGLLFSFGFVATLGWLTGQRVSPLRAAILLLPILCSSYIFSSGVYLLPDNAAWWGVTAILALALSESISLRWFLFAGLSLALLVLMRQVHAWTGGLIVIGAFLTRPTTTASSAADSARPGLFRSFTAGLIPEPSERPAAFARALLGLAVCIPAALIVLAFIRLWHGLTPPAFQPSGSLLTNPDYTNVGGISLISPGFILANLGVFGLFYLPLLWPTLKRRGIAEALVPAGLFAVFGAAIALIGPSSWNLPLRISGLWSALKGIHERLHIPYFADRSIVLIALAAIGAAMLPLFWRVLSRRDRWVFAAALAGFILTQTLTALAWQRYVEPFVLILLAVAASRIDSHHDRDHDHDRTGESPSAAPLWGPAVLALLLAVVTVKSLTLP